MQNNIRILVTSVFGAFVTTVGGAILFGKIPDETSNMTGRYMGHIVAMAAISVVGIYYQKKSENNLE